MMEQVISNSGIIVERVSKNYGSFDALKEVSLTIEPGELVALLGPSGSGKTTLLRVIAGLDSFDSGLVSLNGELISHQSLRERNIGFVFQHYALFRHMTVFENIAFGLRVKPRKERPQESEIKKTVHKLLELIQLEWLADRYPSQLSGGQRQRVALARALAVQPKVLLLDEPFGALDANVRQELRVWLREFHRQSKVTTILVTHDQEEALEVANKVVIMNKGKIEQIGSPEDVYHHPKNPFVLHFLGKVNLFHSRMEDGNTSPVYIRPDQIEIKIEAPNSEAIKGSVIDIQSIGVKTKVKVQTESNTVLDVDMPYEEFLAMKITHQSTVFLTPKKVFHFKEKGPDYSI